MYTYRNVKTGVVFSSVSECSGKDLELVSAPEEQTKKKPAKGKKK